MKNKFEKGRKLSDKIEMETYWQNRGEIAWQLQHQAKHQVLDQVLDQTHWQITRYIKEAVNEK